METEIANDQDIEVGRRLAGAMFGLGKQQASLGHRMSKSGVDRSTIVLLKTMVAYGPSRSSELAGAVHSDPSTVSRQVAALVRDGLVERRADPEDGRASVLAPTEAGLRLLEEQRERLGLALARVVREWEPEDVSRFLELLERFVADHERALPNLLNECAKPRSEGES
ncbi:MarR family winged helix-turn-helix transcriptional regulator [Actinophytocola gossypii]|uniref:MarR family transcriptional regulator n=1 Tax=Actinophytocola gossypii TaxID=2812003 RepID=A0ABT2J440_9PSEU|nr:MarR family transcriptional regulator [Actinophytocola gossypii]MCT2582526.1 MarR family transcriptional regulator [Actinophytocola gossypii]